ncbi:MAG: Lrp/AsnC ligand binding domain-containing protein [Thermoplasmata archaeon]|nr:Lrp/AsnC ligand binding domain-containing protein [Thermoplasmata archaeon]
MAIGFVLISVAPAREQEVYKKLLKIKEIVELHPLLGKYDFMAKLEVRDFDVLVKIVTDQIRTIDGVVETETYPGVKL